MKVQINVMFDTDTNKIAVAAPMQNENLKKLSIKILSQAICTVLDHKPSPLLDPKSVKSPNGVPEVPPIPGTGKSFN